MVARTGPGSDPPIFVSTRASVERDMGVGGAGGGIAGALVGLGCGPFAAICVPGAAALGMMAGMGAGAIVGLGEPPSESLARLEATVKAYALAHHARDDALAVLKERIAARGYTLALDGSPNVTTRLIVQLSEATLYFQPDGQAHIVVRMWVVEEDPRQPKPRIAPVEQWFLYKGAPAPITSWVDDDGFLARRFDEAYRQIADDVVGTLLP